MRERAAALLRWPLLLSMRWMFESYVTATAGDVVLLAATLRWRCTNIHACVMVGAVWAAGSLHAGIRIAHGHGHVDVDAAIALRGTRGVRPGDATLTGRATP